LRKNLAPVPSATTMSVLCGISGIHFSFAIEQPIAENPYSAR
jgi:hypothetical protein